MYEMGWKLNSPRPPMLVYYFMKFISLAPFTVKGNRFYPPTLLSKIYPISLAVIYCSSATIGFRTISENIAAFRVSALTQFASKIHFYFIFPNTIFTVATFWLMHEKILYIINKLCDIGNELKSLGIEEHHETFLKNVLMTTVKANSILIAICGTLSFLEPNWPIYLSMKHAIDSWVYLNVVLIFAQTLFFISQRFKLMNEKLYNIFRPVGHRGSLRRSQMFVVNRNSLPREETRPGIENLTDLQRLRTIERLHLELCELVDQTTQLFAIPIILKTVQFSTELMLNFFWMYWFLRNSGNLNSTTEIVNLVYVTICFILRLVIVIAYSFYVVHASVDTCEMGNATKAVLFKVWYRFKPRQLENEFFMFSLQLTHKPVTVSAFGYFDLDYSYLYKIFCVAMAYGIILIQFDK